VGRRYPLRRRLDAAAVTLAELIAPRSRPVRGAGAMR
jgi:hypothetical protein